jgi:catechol 2,3-dioxygenase-like lactoylglutathione lyase family enzyme
MNTALAMQKNSLSNRPTFDSLAHVSLPCRDLEEGKQFYVGVLGGKVRVDRPTFVALEIAGTEIGIGTVGCTYIEAAKEYPHIAFYCGPDEIVQMKEWLAQFGIPSSNYWTRAGVEALMFFRDPSGNIIELFCKKGFKGAENLPKGPPAGHGIAVDIDQTRYDSWHPPQSY